MRGEALCAGDEAYELSSQQPRQHVRPPRGQQGGRSRARGRACGLNCVVDGKQHRVSLSRQFLGCSLTEDVPTVDCSMGKGEGEQGQPLHALREVTRQRNPSGDSGTIG